MIYHLKSINREGHSLDLLYDQSIGQLMTADREPIFEAAEVKDKAVAVSPSSPGKKSGSEVKTLKIQLGLKCNYSCTYCTQTIHIPEAHDTNVQDVNNFLSKMDSWLTSVPDRVEFWGGEPLLYLKKLKVLIPSLREKWPNSQFLMISNGELFNDEVVDFIIENDITVAISHDGHGQVLRKEDPIDNPKAFAAMKRMVKERKGKFSFNAVITDKNYDLEKHVAFFKDRFGEEVPVSFEGIVTTYNEEIIKTSRLSDQDLKNISDEIFYALVSDLIVGSSLWESMIQFMKYLERPYNADSRSSKCGMDKPSYLAVDLLGNIMTCQSVGPKSRHFVGKVESIDEAELRSSTHWSHRKNCTTCPVLSVCGGGCMFQEGDDFEESCRADYHQAYGIFRAAIYNLTGYVVTEISAHDKKDPNLIAISN